MKLNIIRPILKIGILTGAFVLSGCGGDAMLSTSNKLDPADYCYSEVWWEYPGSMVGEHVEPGNSGYFQGPNGEEWYYLDNTQEKFDEIVERYGESCSWGRKPGVVEPVEVGGEDINIYRCPYNTAPDRDCL
ncbi:MAG: hypothetical protein LBG99_02155 [Propionibacteriaceae bacterium]|nr:hypothetical protein [Propionibacteriaceae bacterium]